MRHLARHKESMGYTEVIPIDEVKVGSVKAASLRSKLIDGTAKYVFNPKELLLSRLSEDAIPEIIDRLLITDKAALVVKPAREIIPEDMVTLLLSANVTVPKVSSDGIDVAPIL
mgnify:CR=1 FL=1